MNIKNILLTMALASSMFGIVNAEESTVHEEGFDAIESWTWSPINLSSNENWEAGSRDGRNFATISGWSADADSNDWVVSPSIDLSSMDFDYAYLQFDSATNFDGEPVKLFISTDYVDNVETATWTDITDAAEWSAGGYSWVSSDKVDLTPYAPTSFHLAFQYTAEPTRAALWRLDSLQVISTTDNPAVITEYTESFAGSLGEWSAVSLASDRDWSASSFDGNGYARISGYNGSEPSNDYLVSPAFDLTDWEIPYLQFRSAKNFDGDDLKILITTDYSGDVTTTDWTDITDMFNWSEGGYTWVESGRYDLRSFLSADASSLTIAFHYTSTDEASAVWQVDDVLVGRMNPAVIDPIALSTPHFESLNDVETEWQVVNLSGSKTWGQASFDGAVYSSMSGFRDDADSIDWLVSPTYSIADWTQKTLNFYSATRFSGPVLKILASADFVDNVDSATWVDISDRAVLSTGDYEWVNSGDIDVADLTNAQITFAFLYTSDDTGAATWQVDSLSAGGAIPVRPTESNFTVHDIEEFSEDSTHWTAVSLASDKNWESEVVVDTTFTSISGFGGDVDSNDWLVSPTLDTTAVDWDEAFIQFAAAKRYSGENLKLLISTDYAGDVETASWDDISDLAGLAKRDESGELYDTDVWDGGTYEWIDSGEIDISNYIGGNITIAFQYTSAASAAVWRIDYARIVEKDDGFSDEPFVVQPVSGGGTVGLFSLLGLLLLRARKRAI